MAATFSSALAPPLLPRRHTSPTAACPTGAIPSPASRLAGAFPVSVFMPGGRRVRYSAARRRQRGAFPQMGFVPVCSTGGSVDQLLSDLQIGKYKDWQKKLHPDLFHSKSEKDKNYAAKQSGRVTNAYHTLTMPLSRAMYLLQIEGVHVDEENYNRSRIACRECS